MVARMEQTVIGVFFSTSDISKRHSLTKQTVLFLK